jgi:hypothetical protein
MHKIDFGYLGVVFGSNSLHDFLISTFRPAGKNRLKPSGEWENQEDLQRGRQRDQWGARNQVSDIPNLSL